MTEQELADLNTALLLVSQVVRAEEDGTYRLNNWVPVQTIDDIVEFAATYGIEVA